ncbi:MAG TPA: hypothetical protein VLA97_09055 [Nocardioidaceae bacterium]|nr:hypothetical protein [Nocardioidaceae bacterium]
MEQLRARLAEESADVERLESFSPTRIWASLRGSRATDLDRETAEREAARYSVAEAEARRAAAERDRDGLRARLVEIGDVEARYAEALRAKEEWLAEADPALAAQLAELAARRGELVARDKENQEAFNAGCAARDRLAHATQLLDSAGSWATWDTFAGGGMFTDMAKYAKLDRASEVLRHADAALQAFSRELADVGLAAVPTVQVDSMTRTFDVFFDNVFTDMAVRHRIQQTSAQVAQAAHCVAQALGALQQSGREIREQVTALDEERERLLA